MCDPVSALAATGFIISAGSKVIEHQAQQQAHDENKKSAETAAANSMRLLGMRQQQEQTAGAQTLYQMDLEARKADAATRVSAGESGVAGASVEALIADIERQQLMASHITKGNTQGTLDQLNEEKKVVKSNMQSQIAAKPAPNVLATATSIGGDGVNALSGYIRSKPGGK